MAGRTRRRWRGSWRGSDVLLAPSRTDSAGDQEGIPVTLMEAMASGLPVVSTRHSGIPELVEHGVSGWLAEEGDVAGLVEGLLRLEREPYLALRFGRAARERIAADYDVDPAQRPARIDAAAPVGRGRACLS